MIRLPGRSHSGPQTPLTEHELEIRDIFRKHVQVLAGDIGERTVFRFSALEASAQYIEQEFKTHGYAVSSQEFEAGGKVVKNLEVEVRGASTSEEIVVVGAHYYSVPGSPGANDNGSGVAAVLEFARLLARNQLPRAVRLVTFVNEEPPFFRTRHMGSLVYARRSRKQGDKITAMLSIETIGCYSNHMGSQKYPFPFSLFYPDTGNFIGFVGNTASRSLVHRCIGSFRRHTPFPSEGLAAPGWITGLGWSDHWAFWQEGYPAVMITDTAPFRYTHYHTAQDTPDKVNYTATARVVAGLERLVVDLASDLDSGKTQDKS
jgi:Zn-dependent M28 family amino/carboxypeptidase